MSVSNLVFMFFFIMGIPLGILCGMLGINLGSEGYGLATIFYMGIVTTVLTIGGISYIIWKRRKSHLK